MHPISAMKPTDIIAALEEVIRIGREAQIPVHVSHLKIAGKKNWALRETVVEKLASARSEGIDITCDVYPYFHSSTTILALLPPWSLEGGMASLMPRLKEPPAAGAHHRWHHRRNRGLGKYGAAYRPG